MPHRYGNPKDIEPPGKKPRDSDLLGLKNIATGSAEDMTAVMFVALCLLTSSVGVFGMSEEHRMNEYRKRGYKWPLDEMVP